MSFDQDSVDSHFQLSVPLQPPAHPVHMGDEVLSFERPMIMGILNVTDNSFYEKSRCMSHEAIRQRAREIAVQGGDIVDLGACSTKPGSEPIAAQEEEERILQAIEIIREEAPGLPISIDTYRASVARAAIEKGNAEIINDIASGEMDPEMLPLVAEKNIPYILTHIQGTPTTMQQNPQYEDLMAELIQFFSLKIMKLREMGASNLILDPGFGFGKTVEHNYAILRNLDLFHELGLPILVGVSRKNMIYRPLDVTPIEALPGTQVVNTIALLHGAHILRVHDVLPAVQAVRLAEKYFEQPRW